MRNRRQLNKQTGGPCPQKDIGLPLFLHRNISPNNRSGISYKPTRGRTSSNHKFSPHHFKQKTVGAYRIRPHSGEQATQTKPSPHNFNRTSVGAYRIRPHISEQCSNKEYSPHHFKRTCVGAYRIRPHFSEQCSNNEFSTHDFNQKAPQTIPANSPHTCNIANMKGVCDTPLHIFD